MIVLGLGNRHHDPSACIIINGKLIAAAEEERFTRDKHSVGAHPINAIQYCLKEAGLKPEDITHVAHAASPEAYDRHKWAYFWRALWKRPSYAFKAILKAHLRKKNFASAPLETLQLAGIDPNRITLRHVEHHIAHAASAFYFSGFKSAAFMTMDGSGEFTSTMLGYFDEKGEIHIIKEFIVPDSLGFFYATLTDYLGFEHDDGEYKVMGMAPYGDASRYDLSDLLPYDSKNKTFRVNDDYIYAIKSNRVHPNKFFSKKLVKRLGPEREGDALLEPYIHIAAATQKRFEEVSLKLIDDYLSDCLKKMGGRLVFSGGCALNVKLNKKIIEHPLVTDLWVQPASNDAGLCVGAAAIIAHEEGHAIAPMTHSYWGPQFTDSEIEAVFSSSPHKFTRQKSITETASQLLHQGEVVAWFQGRMEWGPRALGNRSILGNPAIQGTADKINDVIKFRELWRPFCPSILSEYGSKILHTTHDSPFMTFCFEVRDEWKNKVPEIVHVDNTARPQFVTREANPLYYELIEKFHKLSGLPLLINTSLNRKGEPMVCSPKDALQMFEGSGLKYLAIGNFLVEKQS